MADRSARIGERPAKALPWAALVPGAATPGLAAALEWNRGPALSSMVHEAHGLHAYVMLFVTLLWVGVFGFMFFSVYAHRRSKAYETEHFHENTTVEFFWTVIPAIVLAVIALPAAKVVVAQKSASTPGITVEVIGDPWKWGYDYARGEGAGTGIIPTIKAQHDAGVLAANCALHQPSGQGMPAAVAALDRSKIVPGSKNLQTKRALSGNPIMAMMASGRQRPGAEHSMSAVLDIDGRLCRRRSESG